MAKLAVVVAHYGPDDSFRRVLATTIQKIRRLRWPCSFEVVVADDGSAWTTPLGAEPESYRVLDREDVASTPLLASLGVDRWVAGGPTTRFRKAELCNAAVAATDADFLVFLDDDVWFRHRDDLRRIADHLERYDLVFGRVQYKNGVYGQYRDGRVAGTNLSMRRSLFDQLGGFGEHTAEWGHGVDSDFFWRAYTALAPEPGAPRRAVYAGEVLTTRDESLRRRKTLVDRQVFLDAFQQRHGVHPHDNASRRKWEWMDHSSRAPHLAERAFEARSSAARAGLRVRARIGWFVGRS